MRHVAKFYARRIISRV